MDIYTLVTSGIALFISIAAIIFFIIFFFSSKILLFRVSLLFKIFIFLYYISLQIKWITQDIAGTILNSGSEIDYNDLEWTLLEAMLFITMIISDWFFLRYSNTIKTESCKVQQSFYFWKSITKDYRVFSAFCITFIFSLWSLISVLELIFYGESLFVKLIFQSLTNI